MKRFLVAALAAFSCTLAGCPDTHASDTPPSITPLNIDQLQQLLPFMVELRARGDVVRKSTRVELAPGRTLEQHTNSRSYTFSVWVDPNGRPLEPDSKGQVSAALKPSQHHGTFEIVCIGGCTVNTSGGPTTCEIIGCEPVDNACGCTTLECPGCLSAGCLPGGFGAIAGKLVMF
jgi:hypothetical protein